MNLVIVEKHEFVSETRVLLGGRRAQYIREVHRASVGDVLRVGVLGGKAGTARVVAAGLDVVELEVAISANPPLPVPLTLLLAMPRPKCFRRILQTAVTMGIKRVAIFGSYRGEKSYWDSPFLLSDKLDEDIRLALEQGRDTMAPIVSQHPLFKPFIEDVVPKLIPGSRCLVAHPEADKPCPMAVDGRVVLAIGPEGGFTTYEINKFIETGFEPVSLGSRILKTEQAVPYILGRILPL